LPLGRSTHVDRFLSRAWRTDRLVDVLDILPEVQLRDRHARGDDGFVTFVARRLRVASFWIAAWPREVLPGANNAGAGPLSRAGHKTPGGIGSTTPRAAPA